jgi:hypothetical protein
MVYLEIVILIVVGLGLLVAGLLYLISFLVRRGLRPRSGLFRKKFWLVTLDGDASENPVRPRGQTQHIYLKIPDMNLIPQKPFDIQLTNGKVVGRR